MQSCKNIQYRHFIKEIFLNNLFFLSVFISVADLPSIDSQRSVKEWKVAGPFLSVRGEVSRLTNNTLSISDEFISRLSNNGAVRWFSVKPDGPSIKVRYPNVDWQINTFRYGHITAYATGYALGHIVVPKKSRALVHLNNISGFSINGINYPGEPYPYSFTKIPVTLDKGVNKIILTFAGKVQKDFYFNFLPVTSDLIFLEDYTIPDLIEGKIHKKIPFSISVVNTTSKCLENISFKIKDNSFFKESTKIIERLEGKSITKLPLFFTMKEKTQKTKKYALNIEATINDDKVLYGKQIPLDVKNINDPHKKTFISNIDNSAQYYAILYPKEYKKSEKYAVIFLLHGAGVEAIEDLKNISPKDWAFVVAPTNRRPYGFDWHDQGRIDFKEVFEIVKKRYSADDNRLYLLGASMGGQGVWHIGLKSPTSFAALASHAAWTSKSIYVPDIFSKTYLYTSPEILALRNRALFYLNNPYYTYNASHLPVYISHGAKDKVVPPIHSKIYWQMMKDYGHQAIYDEYPTGGHVWKNSNSIIAYDNQKIMEFFKKERRKKYPKRFRFKVFDLSINSSFYWITVKNQEKVLSETTLDASVSNNSIKIKSENVKTLELDLDQALIEAKTVYIDWNGNKKTFHLNKNRTVLLNKDGPTSSSNLQKTPEQYGLLKSVFFSPFALVYGTKGSANETNMLLEKAKAIAYYQWRFANGQTKILPDIEAKNKGIIKNYNIVLLGGPDTNYLTHKIMAYLPVKIERDRVLVGNTMIYGELALNVIYPNPLNKNKYTAIFAGNSFGTESLSLSFLPLIGKPGTGDFIVFSKEVDRIGWGAVKSLGFFSNSWDLSSEDYIIKKY